MPLPAARFPLSTLQKRTYLFAWLLLAGAVLVEVPIAAALALLVVFCLSIYQRRFMALTVLLLGAALVASLAFVLNVMKVNDREPAGFPPPDHFPILIVVKNEAAVREAHVIYYKELEAVQRRFPEWSFLVAPGDEKRMKKRLEGQDLHRTPTGAEIWFPSFSVSDGGPDRQRFKVSGTPDDDVTNRSWYAAEKDRITPLFHEDGRDEADLRDAFIPFALTIFCWVLIAPFVLVYVAKKTAPAAARPV